MYPKYLRSHRRKMGDVGRNQVAETAVVRQGTRAHTLLANPFGHRKAQFKFESRQAEVKTPSRTSYHGPRSGSRGEARDVQQTRALPLSDQWLPRFCPTCSLLHSSSFFPCLFMSVAAGCDILAQDAVFFTTDMLVGLRRGATYQLSAVQPRGANVV